MIRRLQTDDGGQTAAIWLDTNIRAHHFISPQYWQDQFATVKDLLLQAEVYVYEGEHHALSGFIGMQGDYIAGIFVRDGAQSGGIGKLLLDYVKKDRARLCLHVYQKNIRAVRFYRREGFSISAERTDTNTGEKEYEMIWQTGRNNGKDEYHDKSHIF